MLLQLPVVRQSAFAECCSRPRLKVARGAFAGAAAGCCRGLLQAETQSAQGAAARPPPGAVAKCCCRLRPGLRVAQGAVAAGALRSTAPGAVVFPQSSRLFFPAYHLALATPF